MPKKIEVWDCISLLFRQESAICVPTRVHYSYSGIVLCVTFIAGALAIGSAAHAVKVNKGAVAVGD